MSTFKNFVQCRVASPITAVADSIGLYDAEPPYTLPSEEGGLLVLTDSPTKPSKLEVISYTSRSALGLHGVTRGLEETTALEWVGPVYCYQSLLAGELKTLLDSKVDKAAGKQLSDENYSLAEKDKLAGIAAEATKNRADSENADKVHAHVTDDVIGLSLLLDEVLAPIRRYILSTPFTPFHLFINKEKGVWVDPSDTSTLFQNSLGTLAVVDGDPVGLMLDKSQGLELGPEKFTAFTTVNAPWVDNGDGSYSIDGSQVDSADLRGITGYSPSNGTVHVVTVTCSGISSGDPYFYSYSNSPVITPLVNGDNTIRGARNNTNFIIRAPAGVAMTVNHVSVRELKGNHATQTISASRPKLLNGGIVFDKVDDALTINVPEGGITGTLFLATTRGTASYGVSMPAGVWSLGNAFNPLGDVVSAVLVDRALTVDEKARLQVFGIGKGGTEFGAETTFAQAYREWTHLVDFPLMDTSSVVTFAFAWMGCSSLVKFPLLDSSSVSNFNTAWMGCSSLVEFPLLDSSKSTLFQYTWSGCSSLEDFPPNFFDNCLATNFNNAFTKTKLTQGSIDGILVSINSNSTSNGTFFQSGGSAPSTVGQAAIDAMRARGWTVTVTGGY